MTPHVAGRELDARVATKVMGWKEAWPKYAYDGTPSGVLFGAGIDPHGCKIPLPHYSTDIAAAWEVVEKSRHGSHVEVAHGATSNAGKYARWRCKFGMQVFAEADSAPLAICLAALKACGGEC